MQAIHPVSILLMLITLIGYIILSIWLVYKNENKKLNKKLWLLVIFCLPFIGSTVYIISHFMESDSQQIASSNK